MIFIMAGVGFSLLCCGCCFACYILRDYRQKKLDIEEQMKMNEMMPNQVWDAQGVEMGQGVMDDDEYPGKTAGGG